MDYRLAVGKPLLLFTMQIDSEKVNVPGFNRGRVLLCDDLGLIGRWVFSSSTRDKQGVGDWNTRGAIVPPTQVMPQGDYYQFNTERLIRPGFVVDDGFLVTFKGAIDFKTVEGGVRSEIFFHDDVNRTSAEGSLGCIIAASTSEWEDFCKAIEQSVSHIPRVRLLVAYSY